MMMMMMMMMMSMMMIMMMMMITMTTSAFKKPMPFLCCSVRFYFENWLIVHNANKFERPPVIMMSVIIMMIVMTLTSYESVTNVEFYSLANIIANLANFLQQKSRYSEQFRNFVLKQKLIVYFLFSHWSCV